MSGLYNSVKRNCKLFFKDKGMFFSSLITPVILLVLYVLFLAKVFKGNFTDALEGIEVSEKLVNGFVAAQLSSSLLAVCCITVAFCSNFIMVQDKVTGARGDLFITPAKSYIHALAYYIANAVTTLIVCLTAYIGCLIYMACMGWYMSAGEVFALLGDIVLLVMFGTAMSSVINFFLTSQGQTYLSIVSSKYRLKFF